MWLHVRTGPGAGTAAELPPDRPFVLGRQAGCDLVLRDEQASRRHLELVPLGDGRWRASDLGTANGTLLDGVPMTTAVLEGGEDLRVGDVVVSVSRADPSGAVRDPAAEDDRPELATRSMVIRLVQGSTRRARRTAIGAACGLAVAVAALLAILLTGSDPDDRLPAVLGQVRRTLEPLRTTTAGADAGSGTGTGWRLPGGGLVTAAHVVNQGPAIRTDDGRATVLGVAPCDDLAVLRPAKAGGPTARLATDPARAGETVVASGFQPGDGGAVATRGVVSATGVSVPDPSPDVPAYRDVLQTDTALNPGLSGGPLVDLRGRVVGVDVATRSEAGGRALQGVNYAVPIGRALPVLRALRAGRSPAWTGFTFGYPTQTELRDADLPPGLRITGAVPGTPAARSGLGPGTLVAGVDGQEIGPTLRSLCERLQGRVTGDEVILNVAVAGQVETRPVRLRLA